MTTLRTAGARDVVDQDLDHILSTASSELAGLSGASLLITGGAGFLGHYLVQAATRWNERHPDADPIAVTVYDNYARGVPTWLDEVARGRDVTLVEHDIRGPLPDDVPDFDAIIHAAGIASPTFYRRNPLEMMDANVGGLRTLLDHARRQADRGRPVRGFLFFSSSEVYGDPLPGNIPTPETYRGNVSFTGPRACYDEAKRYGETLCVTFARQFGVPVKIVRPFNNYGPGLKITDRRVIPDFAADILSGKDIVVLSDGSPTRTFCYVADAVVGYYKALVRGGPGEPYNIGVEEPEISVLDLAERMAATGRELFGYPGKVVHRSPEERDYLEDNPSRRCPVIAKARGELGYEPGIELDEGLRRSLVWYTEHREGTED
ncbi:MAG: NAD-dependent epimerase/dehydratase family protein [Actinomycetota bacterium]